MGICGVCDKQRATLTTVRSKLLGTPLQICNKCKDSGFEPRYIVIIAARSTDKDKAMPYIKQHKYVGKDILASDIV